MANDNRFVVKNGLGAQNINFTSPDTINSIQVTMLDSDTLSVSGDSGQLFSITDSLIGTIFAVNDISGIPSIEVDDDGTIRFAETVGNVLIGTAIDNGTDKLQVNGTISATTFVGAVSGIATGADQLYYTSIGDDVSYYLPFVNSSSSGYKDTYVDSGVTYNPYTNTVTTSIIQSTGNAYLQGAQTEIGTSTTQGILKLWGATPGASAQIHVSTGNLHINAFSASTSIYLNYYTGSGVIFGNGATGYGSMVAANGQFVSTIVTGTAPFVVASTTLVSNLNADYLDSLHSTSFLRSDAAATKTSGSLTFDDNVFLVLGTGTDVAHVWNGTHYTMDVATGNIYYDIGSYWYIRDRDAADAVRLTFDSATGNMTITGVMTASSFSGNASSATQTYYTNTQTDGSYYIPFVNSSSSGFRDAYVDVGISYNPSTNALSVIGGTNAAYIGLNNTSQTSGNGLSLYGGYTVGQPTYGMMFAGTPTFGTHGSVVGDWAMYFNVNNGSDRGWIFRDVSSAVNVASITNTGIANFDVSVSTKAQIVQDSTNVDKVSLTYNETTNSLDFNFI
jgi:hypothetical protein